MPTLMRPVWARASCQLVIKDVSDQLSRGHWSAENFMDAMYMPSAAWAMFKASQAKQGHAQGLGN